MIDEEGSRLGTGNQDPGDAIFQGSANDFKVRIRARGDSSQTWNSNLNLLIHWTGLNGNSNDFTSFDFELYDADACPALGAHYPGSGGDNRPLLEWDGDDAGGVAFPTFHRFRLAIHADTIAVDPPTRLACDRSQPFGDDLVAGWASSIDGHLTQGVYQDSLWRIEVKDGIPQRVLPNTGQMAPPQACDWNIGAPDVAQDGHHQCRVPSTARLARVSCSTTTGTVTVNLYERTSTAPNSGSAEMLSSDLVCDTDGAQLECDPVQHDLYDCTAAFADDRIDKGNLLSLGIQGASSPGHLRVHAEWY